jgi:hypothetical protein
MMGCCLLSLVVLEGWRVSGMSRLVIVMWAADPRRPVQAAAPFVYALAARAMEVDVQMHFTSSAVRWLVQGEAEGGFTDAGGTRSVRDWLREAHAAGVELYACAMALAEHRRDGENLVAEVAGVAGAATVIGLAMDPATRVLIF